MKKRRAESDLQSRAIHFYDELGEGRSYQAVAREMGMGKKTVSTQGREMSVALADIVVGSGGTPKAYLADHKAYALASITASLARSSKPPQSVCPDPLPDQPAHALVVGPKPKSPSRRFAVEAVWVIKPPNLETKP